LFVAAVVRTTAPEGEIVVTRNKVKVSTNREAEAKHRLERFLSGGGYRNKKKLSASAEQH
jgi:hypothetical protein